MRALETRYAAVLGLVVVVLVAVVLTAPRHGPRRLDVRERLHVFLQQGPGRGLWQIHTLSGTREYLVGDHPTEPGCVLLTDGARSGRVSVHPRDRVARFFMPGDEDLFRLNYRLLEGPFLDEDTGLLKAVWVPRFDWGGQTGRSILIDPVTWEVWGLEDRSWAGRCVRCLTRVHAKDPGLEPAADAPDTACRLPPVREPKTPAELASKIPFPLVAPTYLPEGFELIAANYVNRLLPVPGTEERRRVRLAYLSYSDGLANIDIGVAKGEDMDAFEAWSASRKPDPDDDTACPPVPARQRPVRDPSGLLIRRRQDSCRTVLRLDDPSGVSVRLLGRNEIPEDEYIRVIASVERVMPAAPPPRD